jgi:hypothetical protein
MLIKLGNGGRSEEKRQNKRGVMLSVQSKAIK